MLDKDRVAELVVQSGLHEFGYGHDRERFMTALAYFATAIQHEALIAAKREDAEPVAWMTFDGEGGYEYRSYVENEDYAEQWSKRNPNHVGWVKPLYTHPTPAVARQLVGALRMVMDDPNALDGRPRTYECVQEALAAAKDAGL